MNATLTRWTAAGAAALALAAAGGGFAAAATTPTKATVFTAQLKETGTHTGKASSGTFVGKLGKNGMMTYTLTFSGVTGHLNSALIQSGKTGATGALSVPLTAKLSKSPVTGTIKPTAALLTALRSGKATIWLEATEPPPPSPARPRPKAQLAGSPVSGGSWPRTPRCR